MIEGCRTKDRRRCGWPDPGDARKRTRQMCRSRRSGGLPIVENGIEESEKIPCTAIKPAQYGGPAQSEQEGAVPLLEHPLVIECGECRGQASANLGLDFN